MTQALVVFCRRLRLQGVAIALSKMLHTSSHAPHCRLSAGGCKRGIKVQALFTTKQVTTSSKTTSSKTAKGTTSSTSSSKGKGAELANRKGFRYDGSMQRW